jgi:CheY-like chemotaxis protein
MARVLVVDDDPDLVAIVAFRLESYGHRVIVANSARTALDAAAGPDRPDLVLLDLLAPGVGGCEVLARLRALEGLEHLPAIFLTTQVRSEDVEAGRALGAFYLVKPFITAALLRAIDDVLLPVDQR